MGHRHVPRAALVLSFALLASGSAPARAGAQDPGFEILYDFAHAPGSPVGGLVKGPDGTLFGTASSFGGVFRGGVFSLTPSGSGFTYRLLHEFALDGSDGGSPYAGLAFGADGGLYGTTISGGANNLGTVFRVTTGGAFTLLHSFNGADGRAPMGRLLRAADGRLYGTTIGGGTFDLGTIFRITTTGAVQTLHSFLWLDGAGPTAGLTQGTDGNFYGTSVLGGWFFAGSVFRMTPAGVVTPLHYFTGADGRYPLAALTQAANGQLYGTTYYGGNVSASGTVFRISTTGAFTSLHTFSDVPGDPMLPVSGLVQAPDGQLYGALSGGSVSPIEMYPGALYRVTQLGTVELAHTFASTDGRRPLGDLIVGADGALYGPTFSGGAEDHGSVFRFSPGEALDTIHSFTGRVERPEGLVRGNDGSFYGVAANLSLTGSLFKIAPDGTYTPFHTLLNSEGTVPSPPLCKALDGNFYGTTRTGGANGSGTVFRLTPEGNYSIVTSFGRFDGISGLPLIQGSDGNFYGTMEYGEGGFGSIFRMTPAGVVSTLYSFPGPSGSGVGPIMQASDGALYGVARFAGTSGLGGVFRVALDGAFTMLHSFSGADGAIPSGRLVQASDGHLYGTTSEGGAANLGTAFRITTAGALTTLHSFTSATTDRPMAGLLAASDGFLYGSTTQFTGENPSGTVFRLDPSSGVVSLVRAFAADGSEGTPSPSALVEGLDGALYGTAWFNDHSVGGPGGFFFRLSIGGATRR